LGFRTRILALLVLVGVAPILLLGLFADRVSRAELVESAGRDQRRRAVDLARETLAHVLSSADALRLAAGTIPFAELSPAERGEVLRLPFRQLQPLSALVLLDGRGRALAPPVYERGGAGEPAGARPTLGPAELEAFSRHVPLDGALKSGVAVGPLYATAAGAPRVAVAVRVEVPEPAVLAAELALAPVAERLASLRADGGDALLLGRDGSVVGGRAPSGSEAAFARAARDGGASTATVRDGRGVEALATFATVDGLGWGLLVESPAADAFRPADRVRRYTLYWAVVALALTATVGVVFADGLTRPMAKLSRAAEALAEGRHDAPVDVDTSDEIGRFARAFNAMAGEIRRRDAEIRGWNAELHARVEQRTAELREAQEQIERTRRLAAIGTLGAGVAHELNNPLTGIIGLLTVARAEAPAGALRDDVDAALAEARRAAKVVHDLVQATERQRTGTDRSAFALAAPVRSAVERLAPEASARGVRVRLEADPRAPPMHGDPARVEALVVELLRNAVVATPRGGDVAVKVAALSDAAVRVEVADGGPGVPPELRDRIFDPFFTTRSHEGAAGLGLATCHGIAVEHHGKLTLESEEGRGARFAAVFPAAPARPHLT
jgi:signal transduction histidine kinase